MKKDFLNLKRSRWLLLSLFALLVGVSPTWAEIVTEGFSSSSTLPEGWELKGQDALGTPYSLTSDYNKSGSSGDYCLGTSSTSTSEVYVITPKVTGTVTIPYRKWASGSGTSNIYVYEYTDEGSVITATSLGRAYSTATSWDNITIELGSKETRLAIIMKKAVIDDFTADYVLNIEGPAFRIANFTDGDSFGYGMVNPGTTKEFTLKNPGTESVTVNITTTGGFVSDFSNVTIGAKGQKTVTVTVPDESANGTVKFTPTAVGLGAITINLSCVIKDPNKVYLDFSDGSMPDGWTSVAIGSYASSYGTPWTASTGYVGQSGTSSSYEWAFTSPKMIFSENETIIFETQKYSSYTWYNPSITVQYKTEDGDWTTVGSTLTDDTYDNWTKRSVTIPTADAKYIRFTGWYVKLRNIYGGELPLEPKMVVTQPASLDFGLLDKDATPATKTFTIANTGLATLNGISVSSANAAFTITDAPSSLAAGASQEVTITMATGATGALSSLITVSATGMEDATFTVSGVVMPDGVMVVDFNTAIPAEWDNQDNGWSIVGGAAKCTNKKNLTTQKLDFSGEASPFFVMKVKASDSGYGDWVTVEGSSDNGTTWTAFDKKTYAYNNGDFGASSGDYSTIVVSIPNTVNKLRFNGYYVLIDEIAGLIYDADAPALTVTLGGAPISTGYADNFGGKVKVQPAAHTYTITNSGTGTLEGTITSSVPGHFTVSQSAFSLTEGQSLDFNLNLVFNETYEDKASTITIHPTSGGLADVVINATATTADPNIWEEDFESGVIPDSWINNGWTINRKWSEDNSVKHAYSGSSNANTLTTPRLQAAKDEVLQFEVLDAEASYPLTIKYATSRDGEFVDYATVTESGTATFVAPLEGTNYYYIQFSGRYIYLDDFVGFKEAPLEHDAYITAQNIPATGNQYVDYTATVTVKEMAGKAESGVVAKLYVDGAEKASETKDLTANGTATFTMAFTPDAAIDAKKAYIKVSYEDVELTTDEIDLTIAAATVLNEAEGEATLATGTMPSVVVKYTPAAGWGTITMPFALTSDIMTSIFGEGWKAYELKGFTDNTLSFESTTEFYAGYPYIVYVETPANHAEGVVLKNVSFDQATAQGDTFGEATFQGTYAPMAAGTMDGKWGVTTEAKIAKGTAAAWMKGFRGYFTLPAGASARLAFTDEDGTTTVINALELNQNVEGVYNLQGQKVERMQKGLYIVNGRKVVRK